RLALRVQIQAALLVAALQMQARGGGAAQPQAAGPGPGRCGIIRPGLVGQGSQKIPPGLLPEFLRQGRGFRQQLGRVLRDETGIQRTGGKGRVLQQPQQEAAVAVNATDQGAAQQVQQALPGLFPVVAPGDQLAQQRVVPGADLVALAYAAVDALARPGERLAVQLQLAAGGQEVV